MSKTHLRGNTVRYSYKSYECNAYGDYDKVWWDINGFKELCEHMQTRTAENIVNSAFNIPFGNRFTITRNGKQLSYTKEDLLELLKDASGDLI